MKVDVRVNVSKHKEFRIYPDTLRDGTYTLITLDTIQIKLILLVIGDKQERIFEGRK